MVISQSVLTIYFTRQLESNKSDQTSFFIHDSSSSSSFLFKIRKFCIKLDRKVTKRNKSEEPGRNLPPQSRAWGDLLSEYSVRSHDSSIKRAEIFVTYILTYPLVFRLPAESSRRLFPLAGPGQSWCPGPWSPGPWCSPHYYWQSGTQTITTTETRRGIFILCTIKRGRRWWQFFH